jgi:biotin carboxylase
MGCEVLTADNVSTNPGHRLASASFDVSTVDVRGVIDLARAEHIDGVVTFASDIATSTVARCAHALGLPGAPPAAVDALSNKAAFRRLQEEMGLPHPSFLTVERLRQTGWPSGPDVVVKPTDASGSRGVAIVDSEDTVVLDRAIDLASAASRSGEVILESVLPGIEVGGDAFIVDGSIVHCYPTLKHRSGVVVTGHSLPPEAGADIIGEIARQLEMACQGAGYGTGPLNFDVMIDQGSVTVIEMSPRTGGNGIPEVIDRSYGVSILSAAIGAAVGVAATQDRPSRLVRPSGSLVLGSGIGGTVVSIASPEEVVERVPGVYRVELMASAGDAVRAFDSGSASYGYALFDIEETYVDMVRDIQDAVALDVR